MTAPNHTLHFICMECQREYKTLTVSRDLGSLDRSHGFCPECEPKVMERYFGKAVPQAAPHVDVEALR